MKHFTLIISRLFFLAYTTVSNAQNPVPNSSFEFWTMGHPVGWSTNNASGLYTTVTMDSPGAMGAKCAKGVVVDYLGSPVAPLLFSQDEFNNNFPIAYSYSTMSFYYQLSKTGMTELQVTVSLFNPNQMVTGSSGAQMYTANTSSWTHATVNIMDFGTGFPSNALINFVLNDPSGTFTLGDYYLVDEVELSGATNVAEIVSTDLERLSPNPAVDEISIYYTVAESGQVDITISDMMGRVVYGKNMENESKGKHRIDVSVSDLASGQYLVDIKSKSGSGSLVMQVVD